MGAAGVSQLWIMVAGPYRSDAVDAAGRAANLRALNAAALAVFRRGHIPVIGVNLALPIIEVAGPDSYDEIMMRLSPPATCAVQLRREACSDRRQARR